MLSGYIVTFGEWLHHIVTKWSNERRRLCRVSADVWIKLSAEILEVCRGCRVRSSERKWQKADVTWPLYDKTLFGPMNIAVEEPGYRWEFEVFAATSIIGKAYVTPGTQALATIKIYIDWKSNEVQQKTLYFKGFGGALKIQSLYSKTLEWNGEVLKRGRWAQIYKESDRKVFRWFEM